MNSYPEAEASTQTRFIFFFIWQAIVRGRLFLQRTFFLLYPSPAIYVAPVAFYSAPVTFYSAPVTFYSAPVTFYSAPLAFYDSSKANIDTQVAYFGASLRNFR